MRSSTSRKRPLRSMTAATVTSGFQTMAKDTVRRGAAAGTRRHRQDRASAAGDPDLALLDHACLPDGIEFLQVLARDRGIIEAGDALGTIGTQAINNCAIVGDAVGGSELAVLRGA